MPAGSPTRSEPPTADLRFEEERRIETTIAESRRITAEVMLSDMDLALTLLDTAAASHDSDTSARCQRYALECFVQMRRRLSKPGTAPALRAELWSRMAALHSRLRALYSWDQLAAGSLDPLGPSDSE
jgi:hypothetical protein